MLPFALSFAFAGEGAREFDFEALGARCSARGAGVALFRFLVEVFEAEEWEELGRVLLFEVMAP